MFKLRCENSEVQWNKYLVKNPFIFNCFKTVERRLAQIESSLNLCITGVETSLDVAHEKVDNLERRLVSLETELQLQETENRKAAIKHGLRSKEFNLLFHGILMKVKSENSETYENTIRAFTSEKLHFSASNLDRIIFSNVHSFPRKTSTIASSTYVTASPIVVKLLNMKDRNSILNLASHARQFKCSITKHLPLAMQTQRGTLLKTANELYKQGKRI